MLPVLPLVPERLSSYDVIYCASITFLIVFLNLYHTREVVCGQWGPKEPNLLSLGVICIQIEMVKGTWHSNKIRIQRAMLLSISGAIICGILHGYINYHQKVSEYMQSMAYREFLEAKKEYQAKLMRARQIQSTTTSNSDDKPSSKR